MRTQATQTMDSPKQNDRYYARLLDGVLKLLKNDLGVTAKDLSEDLKSLNKSGFSAPMIGRFRKEEESKDNKKRRELLDYIKNNICNYKATPYVDEENNITYFEISIIEDLRKVGDLKKDEDYYIYYYLNSANQPSKGLLRVDRVSKKVVLELYMYRNFTHNKNKRRRELANTYFGNVEYLEQQEQVVIRFSQRKRYSKPIPFHSFCIFKGFLEEDAIGIFADSTLSCGLVFVKKSSKEDYERLIKEPTPDDIRILLFNNRISLSKYLNGNDLYSFLDRKKSELNKIAIREGVYKGYAFSFVGNNKFFQKLIFKIKRNGKVNFKSMGSQSEKEDEENEASFEGQIGVTSSGENMIAVFSPSEDQRFYKIQMIFDLVLSPSLHEHILIGIYSGISAGNRPMAGRILLFKESNHKKDYKTLKSEHWNIRKQKEIENFFREEDNKNIEDISLKKFFMGELDTFVDPPSLAVECPQLLTDTHIEKILGSRFKELTPYRNDKGLEILSERIKKADICLNTRIVNEKQLHYYPKRANKWNESIRECVQNGLVFKEIVSGLWIEQSKSFMQELGSDYKARYVDFPFDSMLNFTVIIFDDHMESWFGWAVNKDHDITEKCFQCTNQEVASFFESLHKRLFEKAIEIK